MTESTFCPTVDVVIPVKNGERYVLQALQSVLAQSYPIAAVYVVNDGSTDGTSKVCQDFAKLNTTVNIISNQGQGVSAARNTGISACMSDYIAFLDCDDRWFPQKIELQISRIQQSGQPEAAVYVGYVNIDEHGNRTGGRALPQKEGDLFIDLLIKRFCLTSSASGVLAPRDAINRVGGFDSRMSWGEDWDLWIRLAKELPFLMVAKELVEIRVHSESAQRRIREDLAQLIFFQHSIIFSKWPKFVLTSFWFMRFYVSELASAVSIYVKKPKGLISFFKDLKAISNELFWLSFILMPLVMVIILYRYCKKSLVRIIR